MARITAQEAAQIINQEQRELNGRHLPPTLNRIRVLMRDETFCICNVGPWPAKQERGCITVLIPGYDPKLDTARLGYAKSDPMPSVRREAKIIDEHEFGWFEDDGRQVALDLIGVGFGMHPMNSLVQYGVFVPEGREPTEAELNTARKHLSTCYDKLIEEARDAYDRGPQERKDVIGDRHLLAARTLGINEPWVHHKHTQESEQCPMCGKFNPVGIAMCQCSHILDMPLYVNLKEKQERMLKAASKQ